MAQDQNHQQKPYEDEIDLREIWNAVWDNKWLIVFFIFMGSAVGVGIALTATPRYRAEMLISSVNSGSSSSGSALRSQFGGLASLAGVDLSGGGGREEESIAILQSRSFIATFITENNLMPVLTEGVLTFGIFLGEGGESQKQPTLYDGVRLFKKILSVEKDRKTNLITLAIEWKNPQQAADWANQLVGRANMLLRAQEINGSEKTMNYLEQEISKTSSIEVRQAMYNLIESQVKTISVARTQDEFAFKVLDPAVVPDINDKVYPKKKNMAIMGFVGGLLVGVLFVFTRKFFVTNFKK